MIIPTLNEEFYLHSCLEAIRSQSSPYFEILVVDGYSDDHTQEIAEKIGARIVFSEKRSPAVQRNLGAKLAKGEVLVFIDADTVVSENLLEEFNRIYNRDKQVIGLFPKFLSRDGEMTDALIFWVLRNILGLSSLFGVSIVPSACAAYMKKPFLNAGGFSEDIINGEDTELSLRIKRLGKIKCAKACYAKTSSRRLKTRGRLGWMKDMIVMTLPLILSTSAD